MAHFAEVDENNIVLRVLVVDDMHEQDGANYLSNVCGLGGTWLKASYNTYSGIHTLGGTPFRKNFPGIGYQYDEQRDAFIPPKPFDSHILDEEKCVWIPPVPMPDPVDEKIWVWSENTLSWELLDLVAKE